MDKSCHNTNYLKYQMAISMPFSLLFLCFFAILFGIISVWLVQARHSSIQTPRNLVLVTRSIMGLLSVDQLLLSQTKFRGPVHVITPIQDPTAFFRATPQVYVTQGTNTRRLSAIIYGDTRKNRRERFSSLKFFISAGAHKIVLI